MHSSIFLPVLILIIPTRISSALDKEVEIEIPQGRLLGVWKLSLGGNKFAAFEGVPFAMPPIGKRRFKKPQQAKPWKGIWNAKQSSKECIQWFDTHIGIKEDKIFGVEDCLYLNVYTPKLKSSEKLPVIVYVHGGAFMFGSGKFHGPEYLLDRDVVYVSINYRLGPLGFLSTQDDVVPGNNGLKDQVMAFKWVHDNIQYFGGDPKSVTAMGMSAGGASVNYLLLSPLSKGLIHRGISESGTSCCPWTLQTRPAQKAALLANLLGCPTGSNREMINCLRNRPAASIVGTVPHFIPYVHSPFSPFAPVIEPADTKDAFIKKHPYQIIRDGEASDVPWLNSVTTHEGIYPAGLFIQREEDLAYLESRWEELVPHVFDFNDTLPVSKHADVAQKIKLHYMNGEPISMDTFPRLIDALSDRHFFVDVQKCAKLQASIGKQPVYFYQFAYSGQESLGNIMTASNITYGVSHGDDTSYIIQLSYMNPVTAEQDKRMIKFMVNMAVEFAYNGIPKIGKIEFPQINAKRDKLSYVEITGPNKYSVKTRKHIGSVEFWNSLGLLENEHFQVSHKDEL